MAFYPRKLLPLDIETNPLYNKQLEVIISPSESDIERHYEEIVKYEASEMPPDKEMSHEEMSMKRKSLVNVFSKKTSHTNDGQGFEKTEVQVERTADPASPILPTTVTVQIIEDLEPYPEPDTEPSHDKVDKELEADKAGTVRKKRLQVKTSKAIGRGGSSTAAPKKQEKQQYYKPLPTEADLAGNILEALYHRRSVIDKIQDNLESSDVENLEKYIRETEMTGSSFRDEIPSLINKTRVDMQTGRVGENLETNVPTPLTDQTQGEISVDQGEAQKIDTATKSGTFLTEIPQTASKIDEKIVSRKTPVPGVKKKTMVVQKVLKPKLDGKRQDRKLSQVSLPKLKGLGSFKSKEDQRKTSERKGKQKEILTLTDDESEVGELTRTPLTASEHWLRASLMARRISKPGPRKKTPELVTEIKPEVKSKRRKKSLKKSSPDLTAEKEVLHKKVAKERVEKIKQDTPPDIMSKHDIIPKADRQEFEKMRNLLKSDAKQDTWFKDLISPNVLRHHKKRILQSEKVFTGDVKVAKEPSSSPSTSETSSSSSETESSIFKEPRRKTDEILPSLKPSDNIFSHKSSLKKSTVMLGDEGLETMTGQFFDEKKALQRSYPHDIDLPVIGMLKDGKKENLHDQSKISTQKTRNQVALKCGNIDPKVLVNNYMNNKQVYELFEYMMNKLLLEKPQNPLDYLINLVGSMNIAQRSERGESPCFWS